VPRFISDLVGSYLGNYKHASAAFKKPANYITISSANQNRDIFNENNLPSNSPNKIQSSVSRFPIAYDYSRSFLVALLEIQFARLC
jgi:hypothetical protein